MKYTKEDWFEQTKIFEAVGGMFSSCPFPVTCSDSLVEAKQLCGLPGQHRPGTKMTSVLWELLKMEALLQRVCDPYAAQWRFNTLSPSGFPVHHVQHLCSCVPVFGCVRWRFSSATGKQRLCSYLKICLIWQTLNLSLKCLFFHSRY